MDSAAKAFDAMEERQKDVRIGHYYPQATLAGCSGAASTARQVSRQKGSVDLIADPLRIVSSTKSCSTGHCHKQSLSIQGFSLTATASLGQA